MEIWLIDCSCVTQGCTYHRGRGQLFPSKNLTYLHSLTDLPLASSTIFASLAIKPDLDVM